jgi:putative transposase
MPALGLAPTLGVDVGVAAFAATSDEQLVAPLKALAKQQRRLRRYQRAVSRKVKGSANRRKAVVRLGNLHRRIARQRSDWLHKLTTELADRHPVIALEDLRIVNMSASAKGTVEAPGRNVKSKAGLNRSILDAAWGEFRRQLQYKTAWRGGEVIAVPPAYTSRTCRCCGHQAAENRTTQSVFRCVACGHEEHADTHAAKNILAAGYAVWAARCAPSAACGEGVRRPPRDSAVGAPSMKQEPAEASAGAAPCALP